MSNCTTVTTEDIQILYMVIAIPTFVFGLLGNVAFVVALYFVQKEACTYMTMYVGNMAFADSVVLIFLPFKMYSFYNQWSNVQYCLVAVSLYFVNIYVSIFTVMAISVVRYIAIMYPFRAKEILSPRKAVVVCVLIWLINISVSAKFHFVDDPGNNATNFTCFQKIKNKAFPLEFILVLEILGFLLPLLIVGFCSVKIVKCLSKKTEVSSASEKIQCIRIIITNLIIFVVCFSPLHLGYLLKFLVQTYWPDDCKLLNHVHNFVHIATAISNTNCCLDVFTYYFLTSSFWKRVSASLQRDKKMCCAKKNSVI